MQKQGVLTENMRYDGFIKHQRRDKMGGTSAAVTGHVTKVGWRLVRGRGNKAFNAGGSCLLC